jgi:hypothetical protein
VAKEPGGGQRTAASQDLSHLDKKYFLDARRYNCPFCNRGSVAYSVSGSTKFNWSAERTAFLYLVKCEEKECQGVSMHLSYFDFPHRDYTDRFSNRPKNLAENADFKEEELDQYFFFDQPTSFFTLDSRMIARSAS